jgi:Rod binding domain-containing protein
MKLSIDTSTQQSASSAQSDRLLQRAGASNQETRENAKIEKAGKDFESILLGNWLQQAENSFAKVPGGDGQDDDEDAGKDQFQGLAMQSLAGSLTASGGIGIAKMITKHLPTTRCAQRTGPTSNPRRLARNDFCSSTEIISTSCR